jgi:hypothetical protein
MITDLEARDMYDDMLNSCYEEYNIGCCTFSPVKILSYLDPIAYDCGFDDYCSSLASDGEIIEGYNDSEEGE